jgi:hypothetical protein
MTITVQEECFFCKKTLLDQEWVWACKNCGITWCDEHKKTNFNWSMWSGLAKELCPNCGNPLKDDNVEVLPKFSDWRERFGVEETIDQPQIEIQSSISESDIKQDRESEIAEPQSPILEKNEIEVQEAPRKKSILVPAILLIIFGGLAIFGVVSLITFWGEGLYWTLFSIGIIGFGGRIASASIREIMEYYQQKSS